MPLHLVRQDITKMKVDAIVNAANEELKMGGGVCGAIFRAAGPERLQRECDAVGGCPTGGAVRTKGYDLPARYIYHAVGPIWRGGKQGEREKLTSCYRSVLQMAYQQGLESVAFPLISSGIYGYPKAEALDAAISTIKACLEEMELTVYLCIFDQNAFQLSREREEGIRAYIDQNYVDLAEKTFGRRGAREGYSSILSEAKENAPCCYREDADDESFSACPAPANIAPPPAEKTIQRAAEKKSAPSLERLKTLLDQRKKGFSETLLSYIDGKGLKDTQVYKRANLDRKLFSKLRSNPAYRPSKNTAIALAVALELNLDQTRDLLALAGLALSPSSRFDMIVCYFIEMEIYDIFQINEALFAFEGQTLN